MLGAALLGAMTLLGHAAQAETPKDVLIEVGEHGPNALDPTSPTANELSQMVAWNIYDRLVTFGSKTLPDGKVVYDPNVIAPELAESWDVSDDQKTIIFHIRKDATFHDGAPVTANDVKWSFDRAITAGGFPGLMMGVGSIKATEQVIVVDDHTLKLTFDVANKMTLPALTTPIPNIVNSTLAKKHATEKDPWAIEWTRENDAGGGPFKVKTWKPGDQIVFERFDAWKSGPTPALKRVVYREIASAGTRRALLEKGDIDASKGLPPKDYAELAKGDKVNVIGTLMQNELLYLDMNVKIAPFDNLKFRQAVAYAVPYESIMKQAIYNRGDAMFGEAADKPWLPVWPQASHYSTDLDKAKQLIAESGVPAGQKVDLYFDLSQATVQEPMALLIQENLKKIGVEVEIHKVPGSDWFAKMGSKSMPMAIAYFYAWLDYPEYFMFWTYGSSNSVFNTANYGNPELDKIIERAGFETDKAKYDADVVDMVKIVMDEVPRVPIAHLYSDIALQNNVKGYVYWFHTHLDYRAITKE